MDRVYILECNKLFKIGYTSQKTVQDRVNGMKTGNPFPIKILKDYKRESNDGLVKENRLHKLFDDKRVEGEWFKLNEADLLSIDKLMGIDIIQRELEQEKNNIKKEINDGYEELRKLTYDINNLKKYSLKDTNNNHIKFENKKVILKKGTFNGTEVLNGETKIGSSGYFVNVYINKLGGVLYFKRKKGK